MSTHEAETDARNEDILVWVNGRLVPRAEASVSVYDLGFMLGDGVWEGLRLHDGRWGFLDDHLDRLFEAARAIDLDIGRDRAGVAAALEETRTANAMLTDAHARLMVTRGRKARPFQHPKLSRFGPTMVIIMEHSRPAPALGHGLRLATVPQVRGLPMSQDPKLNSHSKLNCVLACIQAEKAGADEALMLDPHGFVNTTNACNFFIVRKGEVWTSTGDYCMNGITRRQGPRSLPRERHPGLREELQPRRRLRRRGGLPHRHLRRPDPGGRDRRPALRRRRGGAGDQGHPGALPGSPRLPWLNARPASPCGRGRATSPRR